ncbi:MAG: VWA domain-containing protein [Acidobacteriota bacterium]
MSRRRAGALLAFLAFGLLVLPASALEVEIVSPEFGQAVMGRVEIVAEVTPEKAIRSVEVFVDGAFRGRLEQPPYRWSLELGEANERHRFEVVAEDTSGNQARDVVVTRTVWVDQEIEVELQQLYVTVTRADNGTVGDLERDDFTVLDEGVTQRLVTFERGDVPLTAVLLVDASDSMRGERLRLALAGARAFVDAMAGLDQASLLLFADHPVHLTPFTGFAQVLASGLHRVEAGGGTALCDHLYAAFKRLEPRQGRRVVLVLSDGIDTTSTLGIDDVQWAARRSQALVYWLRLPIPQRPGAFSSAWHSATAHRQQLAELEALVERSGGRVVPLERVEDATVAFTGILAELRGQYVLGYYPEPRRDDGSWRRVRVRVGTGLTVRARDGYVDF